MPTKIESERAPRAIGPYSPALRAGDFVFVSGQIALDPATGQMAAGDVRAQAERALANLSALLEAAGASWADVVRTTIYLVDMADFAAVNEVYASFVGDPPPARATVEVRGLPRAALVEVDAVAYVGGRGA
ncbi:MAG TPA: Rid family detoxifying hydrolase [Polyangiaceae bacterium]|nr:Rid family detoxifying hydrolase [Polyangiaceae bacterium]